MNEAVYCSHCGAELRSGSAFCSACGRPTSPRVASSGRDRELAAGDKAWIFLGNLCVSPILGIVLYFLWRDERPKRAGQVCTLTWLALGVWVVLILIVVIVALLMDESITGDSILAVL